MDYSLAALKLLCLHLRNARQTPSRNAFSLGGILFQRAWLQGVVVSPSAGGTGNGSEKYLLDDGTGVIELHFSGDFFINRRLEAGMYVMVVGYVERADDLPVIKVHKIIDLSAFPDREATWYLEVIEAFKLFYQPLVEG